jgi:DNA polymerase IV (DinB-like DNA polymerase)
MSYNKKWDGRAIFHVDINSFYSSCEEIRDPSLKGQYHAVIMTRQEDKITKGVVATCSYEAKKLGVKSAMSLSKALELCPGLILRKVDKKYYNNISEKVIKILQKYADILEQASIDEAFLDCTSKISTLDTSVNTYAKLIKNTIKENCGGLLTSIGVASTKSIAKIASDFQKPDGLTIVYDDELKAFLNPLEVERISGIGTKTQKLLKEMNIITVGQLAKTDVQTLIERFGRKTGIWMWHVSNGQYFDPVVPRGNHVLLSAEFTLETFSLDRIQLKSFFEDLVNKLYDRVTRNSYQFKTVGIKLVRTDFSIESRETSYAMYKSDRKSIESVIDGLLDRFNLENKSGIDDTTGLTEKILPIRKIGLKVSNLTRLEKENFRSKSKTLLDYVD